ncbi:unnamed protein product [Arabidopsis halleri]
MEFIKTPTFLFIYLSSPAFDCTVKDNNILLKSNYNSSYQKKKKK